MVMTISGKEAELLGDDGVDEVEVGGEEESNVAYSVTPGNVDVKWMLLGSINVAWK